MDRTDAGSRAELIRTAYRRLGEAQKPAARSAPAYSRFVNRRLGRGLAALAYGWRLRPNQVTAVSAAFTFAAIALLMLVPPSWASGLAVSACLLIGYAFDSADGQLARLTGASGPAGEWLDHVVDAVKASLLPIALAVGLYRFEAVPVWWLLIPLSASVVSAVLFFTMILTEQLRLRYSSVPLAAGPVTRQTSVGWVRAVLALPMDYGVLCLTFLLLGALGAFLVAYTAIVVATAGFLVLAGLRWFAELRVLSQTGARS
jgi:phosphatidylglycerophosphate synthase